MLRAKVFLQKLNLIKIVSQPVFQKLILAASCGLFLFLGIFQHISDSEFWPISLAKKFGQIDSQNTSLYYKFFFHALLKVPYFFELNSVEHLIAVRVLFSLIGLLTLILFFKISLKFYQSKSVAFVMSVMLLTCVSYFSQWSRIRSDELVLFLALLGIFLNEYFLRKSSKLISLALISNIMILTSPKAIYWVLILTIYAWPGWLYLGAPLVGICLIFMASVFVFNSQLLLGSYSEAAHYFLSSWSWDLQNPAVGFYEVRSFFESQIFQLAIAAGGICIFFSKYRNLKHRLIFGFFAALSCLILHPQRYDFFIGALMPFLILPAGFLILRIQDLKNLKLWILLGGLCCVQIIWASSNSKWWRFNGKELEKISQLEELMNQVPAANYFDGIGVLPRQNVIYAYLGPNDGVAVSGAIEILKSNDINFIFRNSRSYMMEPNLSMRLEKNYIEIRRGVFVEEKFKNKFTIDLKGRPLEYYFSFSPAY